jgi:formate hydrogenlyase subunit 4
MPGNLTLVVVALISTVGVIAAALIAGLATVIAAWVQSRGGPR